ncbi:MAG TPA: hypothetical protein VGF26_17530 [Ramlibacter sp.]
MAMTAQRPPPFNDPPQGGAAAISGEYFGQSPDISSNYLSLLLDASGRFVLVTQTADVATGSTTYGQDVFLGTATINGTSFAAPAVAYSHRDAGTSVFSEGSAVAINGVVATTSTGERTLQLSISGATVPPLATSVLLTSARNGYAQPPYTVPVGPLNLGDLTATADGRVSGQVAPNCTIDAAISVTDPMRNVYRMRAVLAGSGCAAPRLAAGTGEFLGSVFVGPVRAHGGPNINFVGLVGNVPVSLQFQSSN